MSGAVDVKPKQEIEDCGSKVGIFVDRKLWQSLVVQTC